MAKIITIGELMLRLTPENHQRLSQPGNFIVNYGGAEANVAISLSQFGHFVSFLSVFPTNDIGDAAVSYMKASGVDTSWVFRLGERLGLYYYEEGYSIKQAKVIYDRKYSAIIELPKIKIDWDSVYSELDLLHVSGITPALSNDLAGFTLLAMKEAKKRHIQVSFDFNYRSKLWSIKDARETFLGFLPYIDICFAGYRDFLYLLGYKGNETFNKNGLIQFYRDLATKYNIKYLACTNRTIYSSSKNGLEGYFFFDNVLYESEKFSFEILNRIGAGDAFAAGILHSILSALPPQNVIEFGVGAGVLKHMVNSDQNCFSEQEVNEFLISHGGDINR
jgi:2-dehydro-3-deoxygluconokinase